MAPQVPPPGSEALSPDDWRLLRDLHAELLDSPEAERGPLLDRALAGRPGLRARMDALIRSAATMGSFLAPREPGATGAGFEPGTTIGTYRILRTLGQGGFGVVLLAEQERPLRRQVALKLIKPGMDTRAVIARFEAERQALALMDHPAIARVFDAGETAAGRPYFAMEYFPGVPITAFCDAERLSVRDRLALFVTVCDAVQHAHQRGVLHRDLKPTNLLVRPGEHGPLLKVIDFGIGKAIGDAHDDAGGMTREGMVVGTLGYMSPEQAGALRCGVDTRSDLYSLGVVLYELLVGQPPFERGRLERAEWSEALRVLAEEDPPTLLARLAHGDAEGIARLRTTDPRALRRLLKDELGWITARALEREPDRRYASASELAADVRRFIADEPVLARAPSTAYRVRKFVRRHRVSVAATAVVLLALLAGGVAATIGLARAVRAERDARRESATAREVSDFLVGLFSAAGPDRARGQTLTAQMLLEEGTRRIRTTVRDDPAVRARLLTAMGTAHLNLALDEQGLALLREALAVVDSGGRREPRLVARQLCELAHGLRVAGRRHDPEIGELTGRSLAVLAADRGDHRDLEVMTLRLRGAWLNDRGERAPADSLLARGIALAGSIASPDTFELISMHATRGTIADRDGRVEDQERSFRRALALSEASGRWPSWSVNLHQRLASFHGQRGDSAASMRHAEAGVALARRIYPPGHPNLASALNGEVEALMSVGRFGDAIETQEEAVRILRASGREAELAAPLNSLGILYLAVGQTGRAVERSDESWRIAVRGNGAESLRAAELQLNLARALHADGRTARADSMYRQTIAVYDRLEPTSVFLGHACGSRAVLLRDSGRLAAAEPLFVRAQSLFDTTDAVLRRYHASYLGEHAYLRALERRHDEAEAMFARATRMWRGDSDEVGAELAAITLAWAAARARGGALDGARVRLREARAFGVTEEQVADYPELRALTARAAPRAAR